MKTFGLFIFIWIIFILATFNIFKAASEKEITLVILSTIISYIFYKLLKEKEE